MIDHLSVSCVAAALGVSRSAANTAILPEGNRRLIGGVTMIGMGEQECGGIPDSVTCT